MSRMIFFERLSLSARIGTGEKERSAPQRVLVSGKVFLAPRPWEEDAVGETADYDALVREVVEGARAGESCLLERLGEHLIGRLMERFSAVSRVELEIWKDPLPLPVDALRVGVVVRASRSLWEKSRQKTPISERIS